MDGSEKLRIEDVVTLLRTWAANRLYGKITVHIEEGRIIGIRPGPYLRTATQFRRHLPEVKQA